MGVSSILLGWMELLHFGAIARKDCSASREARMFPLTRPFRQALATLALVVLTVVPTGFVAVMAWRINRPGHVRDVEIELGRQIGLQVPLEDFRYPRPGEVVYRGIVLRQEEPRGRGLA